MESSAGWRIAGSYSGSDCHLQTQKSGPKRMSLRHRLPAYLIAPLILGTAVVTMLGVFSESRAVQGHWLLAANLLAAGIAAGIACSAGFAVKYGRSKNCISLTQRSYWEWDWPERAESLHVSDEAAAFCIGGDRERKAAGRDVRPDFNCG